MASTARVFNMGARVGAFPEKYQAVKEIAPFTRAESAILNLLTDGHCNESISNQLGITEDTTKRHVSTMLAKMRFASRTELVCWYFRMYWQPKDVS